MSAESVLFVLTVTLHMKQTLALSSDRDKLVFEAVFDSCVHSSINVWLVILYFMSLPADFLLGNRSVFEFSLLKGRVSTLGTI